MNATFRKATCVLLSVLMTLSVMMAGMTAVLAEGIVVDGQKDAAYTDDKMTVISTAYAGSGQVGIENPQGWYSKSWYTWDDTTVYVYFEVYDPDQAAAYDLVYYLNDVSEAGTYTFQMENGGYFQYDVTAGTISKAGSLQFDVACQVTETGRSYEFKFARLATEGFSFSPVVSNAGYTYTVAYHTLLNTAIGCKKVLYNDEATWKDETAVDSSVLEGPARIAAVEELLSKIPADFSSLTPDDRSVVDEAKIALNALPSSLRNQVNADLVQRLNDAVEYLEGLTTDGIQIDGEKDADYTDDKMTVVSTAYAGGGQGRIENPQGWYSKTWYTWDNTTVYVYCEIYDPNHSAAYDLMYYLNDVSETGAYTFADGMNGGYFQYTVAGGALATGGALQPKIASKVTETGRAYEFKFDRLNTTGFSISPVISNADVNYTVSYFTTFNNDAGCKKVLYNDEATWKDESAVDGNIIHDPAKITAVEELLSQIPADFAGLTPDNRAVVDNAQNALNALPAGWRKAVNAELIQRLEGAIEYLANLVSGDIQINAVKENAYTDDKMTFISMAFGGVGAQQIDNSQNFSSRSWYTWDDEFVYYYCDVYDPEQMAQYDVFYFVSDISDDLLSFVHQAPNGVYYQYEIATGEVQSGGELQLESAHRVTSTGRAYEFKFQRKGETGFSIGPVVYGSATYTVSYKTTYYNPGNLKQVFYNNEATWKDETAVNDPESGVAAVEALIQEIPADIDSLTTAHYTVVDTADKAFKALPVGWETKVNPDLVKRLEDAVAKMKELFAGSVWIDGEKDEAYNDDAMTIISTAYAGPGGFLIDNTYGVYSKTWYTWDDESVYCFVEIYDPEQVTQMDVFYVISDLGADGSYVHEHPMGGYAQYAVATMTPSFGGALVLDAACRKTETGRAYEFRFDRLTPDGFSISPLIYVNEKYTVSYHTNYFVNVNAKQVLYDNDRSWFDDTATDGVTVDDPAKITAVEELIALIPEDIDSITLENSEVVNNADKAYNALPSGWKASVNAELVERLNNAKAKIVQLKNQAIINALIADIAALPATDDITLEQETTILDLLARYNALADDAKDAVTNANLLTAAVAKLDQLKADVVIAQINALPEADQITSENATDVQNARTAFEGLTDAQQALVSNLSKLEAAEAALKALEFTLGDINNDGKIDAADALLALQHSVKLIKLEGNKASAADVNRDDKIDAADALKILQFSVNLIKEF